MKLRDQLRNLKAEQEKYHENAGKMTQAQMAEAVAHFKKLRAEITAKLTEGAKDCEGGHRPLGMFHDGTPNPFEIGDPVVRNRRVRAALPDDAVEDWNNDKWLPPREPGTAVATHADATGKVISQKTVRVQPGVARR